MTASQAILNHEKAEIDFRYTTAYADLLRHAKESPVLCEVVCEMLTSYQLPTAAASLRGCGYRELLTSGPLDRMERVAHFIGYDLMDDGDPGLCWHRHVDWETEGDGDHGFVDCLESDEYAQPYWERRKELREHDMGRIKLLSPAQVLWTLKWHTRHYQELQESVGDGEEWQQCMDDHKHRNGMLYALASEIRRSVQS